MLVDFLPPSFRKRQLRRRRQVRQRIELVVVGCIIAVIWAGQRGRVMVLQAEASAVAERVELAQAQQAQLQDQADRVEQLVARERLQRELDHPLHHTQIVAAIGRAVPESVALREMRITRENRQQQRTLDLELHGLAPNDLAVARLVQQLSAEPLFNGVELDTSRGETTQDGLMARSFRMRLTVSLDRDFIAQGVSHAD
jgi:hypothetical protein